MKAEDFLSKEAAKRYKGTDEEKVGLAVFEEFHVEAAKKYAKHQVKRALIAASKVVHAAYKERVLNSYPESKIT